MRKGANKGRRNNQQEESDSQEFIEQDQNEDIEESSESKENLLSDDENEDDQLLKKIQDQIIGSEENLKLTWAAVHALKQEEKLMNEQMDEQMRKIKAKYDQLKKPLFSKISKVVSGDIVDKELYNKHELTKSLNLKKFKPARIPGFWVSVFESVGLLGSQQDKKMFESCSKVECLTTLNQQKDEETITIGFYFEENQFFSNKQLKLAVHRKETSVDIQQISRIQFKKPQQEQQLILKQIFNPLADAFKLYEYADDIQRAYNQAIFFYFYESRIDQDDGQQDDSDDDQDDQDSEEEQDIGKPVKRQKPSNQKIGQKPECNNQ